MIVQPAAASVNPLVAPAWSTTATPDWLFDDVAPELGEAPLKALLYIVRRTWGFRKSADAISLSQFQHGIITRDGRQLDKGAGVKNRTALLRALDELEARGLIGHQDALHADGGHATTVYYLIGPGQGGGAFGAPPPPRRGGGGGRPPPPPPPPSAPNAPTTNRHTNKQEDRKIGTPYPRCTNRGTTSRR